MMRTSLVSGRRALAVRPRRSIGSWVTRDAPHLWGGMKKSRDDDRGISGAGGKFRKEPRRPLERPLRARRSGLGDGNAGFRARPATGRSPPAGSARYAVSRRAPLGSVSADLDGLMGDRLSRLVAEVGAREVAVDGDASQAR